jgi:hypothetical protein
LHLKWSPDMLSEIVNSCYSSPRYPEQSQFVRYARILFKYISPKFSYFPGSSN